jgi:hypothetical protein
LSDGAWIRRVAIRPFGLFYGLRGRDRGIFHEGRNLPRFRPGM